MNSTELHIIAGKAVAEWGQTNREGCVVTMDGETIICCKIPTGRKIAKNALLITSHEVANGMKSDRWNAIGTELMNLYNKEIECQKLRKH